MRPCTNCGNAISLRDEVCQRCGASQLAPLHNLPGFQSANPPDDSAEWDSWIPPTFTSLGWLPDVGVRQHDDKVVLGPSRSIAAGVCVMLGLAAISLIPASKFGWDFPYYVQVFIAIGFAWGAICLAFGRSWIASWIGRDFRVTLTVDLETEIVTIARGEERTVIPAGAVVGLQILKAPAGRRTCQLNLVFRNPSGKIERCNLTTNAFRIYVVRIATVLERLVGWPLLDADPGRPYSDRNVIADSHSPGSKS